MKIVNYTFQSMPRDFYLKTLQPCDIFSIVVAPCSTGGDWSQYVTCNKNDRGVLEEIVIEVRECMADYFKSFSYVGPQEYHYVSTKYKSWFKNLKLVSSAINKAEDTCTCPNNYFAEEDDAENLLSKLKEIFGNHGIII